MKKVAVACHGEQARRMAKKKTHTPLRTTCVVVESGSPQTKIGMSTTANRDHAPMRIFFFIRVRSLSRAAGELKERTSWDRGRGDARPHETRVKVCSNYTPLLDAAVGADVCSRSLPERVGSPETVPNR